MKQLFLIAFALLLMSCGIQGNTFNGKFISIDNEYVYTFCNDSLYIDTYDSGCGCAAYKLDFKEKLDGNRLLYVAEMNNVIYEEDKIKTTLIIRKLSIDKHFEVTFGHYDKDTIILKQ